MIQNIIKDRPTRLFIILGGFFIANALIAEFIGAKIFSLEDSLGVPRASLPLFGGSFSFHLTAGVVLWPVIFIMTDIINEYYGPKGVRFLSFLAVALISFAFLVVYAAIHLSPSEFFAWAMTYRIPTKPSQQCLAKGFGSLLVPLWPS